MRLSQDQLSAIASFYAGRPVGVRFGPKPGTPNGEWGSGGWGGTFYEGNVHLGPFQQKMLKKFLENPRAKSAPSTVAGLAVLIHEAIHGRQTPVEGTGFRDWSNEAQANALGSELVADALQRFFRIKIGSDLSNAYMKAAKSLSGYQGAYPNKTP